MSQSINLASLAYVRPNHVADQLLDTERSAQIAVVDVRDNDYLGGHIKGSIHVPINQLDARLPELLRTLKDKDKVVFHCMLSQQRGPSAALAYARAKAVIDAKERADHSNSDSTNSDSTGAQTRDKGDQKGSTTKIGGQEICVLEGGFGQWQSRYGEDHKLTEGYVKELWESVLG